MKKALWNFCDNQGSFVSENADQVNTLYFPLCNTHPITSSVTPDLHGDLKTGFNSFLLEPVSRIGLSNLKSSRNFWIYINPDKIWSATGVSKDIRTTKQNKFKLEAGLLWQKTTRKNKLIGLEAEITSFIPSSGEPIEIMRIDLKNITNKPLKFIPTCAIPIFGRSAGNLHDHRHVTSLLTRTEKMKFGVAVTPTLCFNESGHKKNQTTYFVYGITAKKGAPEYIYASQEEFCGDDSDLEAPRAIYQNLPPPKNSPLQGKEALAGLRFPAKTLKPDESFSYLVTLGIAEDRKKIDSIFKKFNTPEKIDASLKATKTYWQKKANEISLCTKDQNFDNWMRWINIQPVLRKIFGCSFLPDFDYGRGGRGWRDLWQDALSLILTNPRATRTLLINNFKGVRIDGTNATIIEYATQPLHAGAGFIADRNNLSRVWMDHGIWPLVTTNLYLNQSSDLSILLEKVSYFRDAQLCRNKERDFSWTPQESKELKTKNNKVYLGTILEHILVENLVPFFNVGPHNHIRLENADWNDGLDMAAQFGESVAFSALYANNLLTIAEILRKLKVEKIVLFNELTILLDSLNKQPIRYSDSAKKHKVLNTYFQAVKHNLSGKTILLTKEDLIADLEKKANWILGHIRNSEWLKEGFFNGYYNNDQQKIEGKINHCLRMTLTGQVFAIMGGIASDKQVKVIFKNAKKYLQDPVLSGFRLNTDFKQDQMNLGRAFSFVYGDKENGAFFNHMSVMFAYGLYKRGFVREGFEVINSIYKMALDSGTSKIYPCLPEYFNADGRGMYSYLTGSASWLLLTVLTQVFGIRGSFGDLTIEPKLTKEQFSHSDRISLATIFCQKPLEVKFINLRKKDFGNYSIRKVSFNKKIITHDLKIAAFTLRRRDFLNLANNQHNLIEVILD